jgi:hypothetical protein
MAVPVEAPLLSKSFFHWLRFSVYGNPIGQSPLAYRLFFLANQQQTLFPYIFCWCPVNTGQAKHTLSIIPWLEDDLESTIEIIVMQIIGEIAFRKHLRKINLYPMSLEPKGLLSLIELPDFIEYLYKINSRKKTRMIQQYIDLLSFSTFRISFITSKKSIQGKKQDESSGLKHNKYFAYF